MKATLLTAAPQAVRCPHCEGYGYDPYRMAPDGGPERCQLCEGAGTVPVSVLAERDQWADTLALPERDEDGPRAA